MTQRAGGELGSVSGERILSRIREALESSGTRADRAARVARELRDAGGYRWVGLYDATPEEIAIVAWSGGEAPAHPRFPATQGLCGSAVASGATVVVGDVTRDPRYLTTFGTTRSEMVVPIKSRAGAVVGVIDVESERLDAFSEEDRALLEDGASAIAGLFAR